MQGNASACVRVRFQRHDVLPYAFCFNFLEATGSISFASLLFFLPLFAFPFVCPLYPPTRLPPPLLAVSRGSSAKCTTAVFSTVDAARYIFSFSLSYPTLFPPRRLFSVLPPPAPPVPTAPCLSPSFPSRSIYPFLAMRSLTPPPLRHGVKGWAGQCNSRRDRRRICAPGPANAHVAATSRVIFLSPSRRREIVPFPPFLPVSSRDVSRQF